MAIQELFKLIHKVLLEEQEAARERALAELLQAPEDSTPGKSESAAGPTPSSEALLSKKQRKSRKKKEKAAVMKAAKIAENM